ncbi:Prokaryotic membrane lipoprotein lipid attachment site profile [Acididesulfobacillus acetoxydans]|uniref:Prokaryotic membrane lipoprotein lipid attachment site profile n=1 Tax=Acididesulfobacillus acetoxydans TaxID=1561005 RepID=A0A8S0WMB0_9FIRM|nr:hypothetical protein [Acididesulfobacillus acetoxydans]CAA7600504.1 Prokaryotic membrane lipoprotein lipid attachment site profile [Acididesulfobacillus acetoxydans]CEJ06638.1 Prokaryotic membrane lipoprotein lipid attachment site profile [Acididesulfobacillus acetoxydans]
MFKRKYILQALLVVMLALALAGCAGQSQPIASSSASANPTGGGQTGSAPESGTGNAAGQPGQSGQTNGSRLENIKKALAGLVAAGTITQDQADKVAQAYSQALANGSLRIKGGSEQQNSGQNQILAPLVSNGTLNQNQVNAFDKAISQNHVSK